MSINTKMIAIADETRELTGVTGKLGLDAIATNLGDANNEVSDQADIIAQCIAELEGKGIGSGNISVEDALIERTLTEYSNDRVTTIPKYGFANNNIIEKVSFPAVTTISYMAFYMCSNLETAHFPNVETIESQAFLTCSKLAKVSFPNAVSLGVSAFMSCAALSEVYLPNITTLYSYAFAECSSLEEFNGEKITVIQQSVFRNCKQLKSAFFPLVSKSNMKDDAFKACTALSIVNFPELERIPSGAFSNCTGLTSVSFPKVSVVYPYAFSSCINLETIELPRASSIDSGAFIKATALHTLRLPGNYVCKLSKSDAFASTGIKSNAGSIFVPASRLTSYQTATNWAYFSTQFVPIEE